MKKRLVNKYCFILCFIVILIGGVLKVNFVKDKSVNDYKSEVELHELKLSNNIVSMTEKQTLEASFMLPEGVKVEDINWKFGGKSLSEWTKKLESGIVDESFITVNQIRLDGNRVNASITFDLPYGTDNLAQGYLQGIDYNSIVGNFDLLAEVNEELIAKASIEMLPFESYYTYDNLKAQIDMVTKQAADKNKRYIKTTTIGKSAAGREIYFTIVAKDQSSVDNYEKIILPEMMENPEQLQQKIKEGRISDYQVPIFLNNIHPNESPGVSAIVNFFKTLALENQIEYKMMSKDGEEARTNLNVDELLNDCIFLIVYTDNPDGLDNMTRHNDDYFDLNRDNSYQTQPETQSVTEQIAKWCPITLLDLHGFDSGFLIEPCTPPHNPNVEYDLLIGSMLEQANTMGQTAIANTNYDSYYIPYEESRKMMNNSNYKSDLSGLEWDDTSAGFTATFAMNHGSMGHTIEVPEMNEESTKALVYCITAASEYVSKEKEKLFLNQLEIYKRGIENSDNHAVDAYLVNTKNEVVGRPRIDGKSFFPEYYVLPVDWDMQKNPLEVYKMVRYFIRNGVKVNRLKSDVTVGDTTYKTGTYLIDMHQAKRGFANLVLYDGIDVSENNYIAAVMIQDFPTLRGFDCLEVREAGAFDNYTSEVDSITIPSTIIPEKGKMIVIRNTNNDAIRVVNQLISDNKNVVVIANSQDGYEIGDFLVKIEDLKPLAKEFFLELVAISDQVPEGKNLHWSKVGAIGEAAYVLKTLGFEVTEDQEEAGVLVNTFGSEKYIQKGIPYIGYGNMTMSLIQEMIPNFSFEGPDWKFYEAVFNSELNQENPITASYNQEEYLYTTLASHISSVPDGAEILITASEKKNFFKAGWWPGHDDARGKIMAFKYSENNHKYTVFGIDLTNIGHSQNQYRLLANAVFDYQTSEF